MQTEPSPRSAFTLVEMSIVIVIIGLVMGGAFVGTSMIKQAELKAVISESNRYISAVKQFNLQYGSLPGDLPDATNYWGDDSTYCADATVTNGTPGTCNGNGDGALTQAGDGITEIDRAWQQLGLAKMITENISGLGNEPVLGVNAPRFRSSQTIGWTFYNMSSQLGSSQWYYNDLKNVLTIGTKGSYTASYIGPFITPSEALQLDKKMDDGLPATGRVVALKPGTSSPMPNCTTSVVDLNAQYQQSYKKIACGLAISLTAN